MSPHYSQSNCKVESWHKSAKREYIRPLTSLNHNNARRIVKGFVQYNTQRMHSGIGYVTLRTWVEGLGGEIMVERHCKLPAARQERQMARRQPLLLDQEPILMVA